MNHTTKHCPKVFEIFGDQWNLQIADSLREGEARFTDIQRRLSINSATLANRLKRLEELQLVNRIEHSCDKQSVAYALTDLGLELLPILDQMLSLNSKIRN